jgi:hypothetical protein
MITIDLKNETISFELLPAGSRSAGTVNGTGVDIRNYQGFIKVHLNAATGGTGTLDVKIQDSADNSSFADVSGYSFTQVTTTGGNQSIGVDARLCRRYIRAVSTVGTGPQVFAVIGIGAKQLM